MIESTDKGKYNGLNRLRENMGNQRADNGPLSKTDRIEQTINGNYVPAMLETKLFVGGV